MIGIILNIPLGEIPAWKPVLFKGDRGDLDPTRRGKEKTRYDNELGCDHLTGTISVCTIEKIQLGSRAVAESPSPGCHGSCKTGLRDNIGASGLRGEVSLSCAPLG